MAKKAGRFHRKERPKHGVMTPKFHPAEAVHNFVKLGTAAGKIQVPKRPPRKGLAFSSKIQPRAIATPAPERPVIRPIGGLRSGPIAINPRPARKAPGKPRWRETLKKPSGFSRVNPDSPPSPIECFIDLEVPGVYHLMRATEHHPDHDNEGECQHPSNASSFVSCIGLVVLEQGKIGIFAEFWNNGGQIVYQFGNDDHAIELYRVWRASRSKGKWLHSMVYNNPYVRIR